MLRVLQILLRGSTARAEEAFTRRNALLVLDQQVRETKVGIERLRRSLAAAVAGQKAEERQKTELEERIAALELQAISAIEGGREDLATEAARVIAEMTEDRTAVEAAIRVYADRIAALRSSLKEGERRQSTLERGKRLACAAENARRVSSSSSSGLSTLTEAEDTLRLLNEEQAGSNDFDDALRHLKSNPSDDITARLDAAGFRQEEKPDVSAILQSLKDRARHDGQVAA